jgi:RsmE family RNA methyltransferase
MRDNKHIFSLYIDSFSYSGKDIFIEKDSQLYRRIVSVLRLKENDSIIFFSKEIVITASFVRAEKKGLFFVPSKKEIVQKNKKKIVLLLPCLTLDSLKEVFFHAGQQGIAKIFFVKTEKEKKSIELKALSQKFFAAMIAGCEQAKQYAIPHVTWCWLSLEEVAARYEKIIAFYEKANRLFVQSSDLISSSDQELVVLAGPEGGFSSDEILFFKKRSETFLLQKLSPYTLRTIDVYFFAMVYLNSL